MLSFTQARLSHSAPLSLALSSLLLGPTPAVAQTGATSVTTCLSLLDHRVSNFCQAMTRLFAARWISSDVVMRPTDSRTAPAAPVASTPIAARTPLTASCSEWHADPTDAARTSATSANKRRPLTPGKETCSVFGSRCSGCPLSCSPGIAAISAWCSWFRKVSNKTCDPPASANPHPRHRH